ncbi:hypothetical protein [Streptomyces lunaelactis]|uniref:hypothetical protein n=1 Tax=Streptomyces lunaelactis TaxID=1535768 RepID=UPI001585302E|nr:hypothetical protein [Streptomyces lunaelactis]NUK87607.1 hypothetical protein [Streptomyces lunaelactis]
MYCCLSAPHDFLRSAATLAPALLRALHLGAHRSTAPARHLGDPDAVSAVNLELVTLTEDRAVITWYTGVPGSDDGLGRMLPAVTEGEVVYGTHPARLNRTAAEGRHTAYH